ncbi:hypothetical protein ACQ86O_06585 [Serratia sp. L9]|uniref:hypothetical protein n=1 Tax=Serratia sp. L9 TaxID=3423946 RepID=UPI003D6680DD
MSSSVHIIRARSEDIAEYRRSIACLSALMQQWDALNQQHSDADPVKIEQIRQRYLEMQRYGADIRRHSAEGFAHLIGQIPGMIEFVRQDIEQVQEALIEQHTEQRQRLRAQQGSANTGQILSQIMLTIDKQPTRLTEQQQALAQRLKEPEPAVSPHPSGHQYNQRLQRIDRHIAELVVLDPQRDMASFTQRVAELERLPQLPDWNMLSDSLTLDLADATRATRMLVEKRQQLSLLANGLASYNHPDVSAMIERINRVLTSRELPLLIEAIAAAQAETEQQQLKIAALARREAVLDGLAKLGYEVHESDAGAWLAEGKVVIRKPATPGYGLELAGAQGSERFQVRAVAFSEQRDTQRDGDIESIWCGEHQKLQQILAETGDTLTVERALVAGASALKVARPANSSVEQNEYRHHVERSRSLD